MKIPKKTIVATILLLAALLVAPATCSCWGPPQPVPDALIYQNSTGIALDSVGNILVTTRNHAVRKYSSSGEVMTTWGSEGSGEGQLGWATYSGSDSQGFVYIADQKNRRIEKFSSDGTYVTHWDYFRDDPGWCPVSITTCEGNWGRPTHSLGGIASGPDGNLYIADVLNNSVTVLSPDGKFLATWGSDVAGTGNTPHQSPAVDIKGEGVTIFIEEKPVNLRSGKGQLFLPLDVAVDQEGNVFVSDYGNYRIQKFSSNGTFLTAWGSEGAGDGQFFQPGGITVDRNGFVYVIDTGLLCVKKFTNNGTFVTKWGERGSQNGQFLKPFDVVIDEDGYIYITDSSDESVQKFTADGVFLSKWETSRKEPDRITEQSVFNIFDLMNSSSWKTTTTKPVLPNPVKRTLKSIVLDSADNIYIADNREMIWKFSPSGNLITYWGSPGYGEGQFQGLESIAVDRGNFIYSVEQSNNRIQKFSSDGEYISHWDFLSGNKWTGCLNTLSTFPEFELFFHSIWGITTDIDGNLYIADKGHDRIYKITPDGKYLEQWGSSGSGEGQFNQPDDIAFDREGNLFVLDQRNFRIQKFSSNGTFMTSWGSEGHGEEQFSFPLGIGIDRNGFVYVTDSSNSIKKFTNSGAFVTRWIFTGSHEREYASPYDVALDSNDNMYIADYFDSCVLKFNSEGTFLMKLCGGDPAPAGQIPPKAQQSPSVPGFLFFPAVAATMLAAMIGAGKKP